jgi:enoyl-CoA hydratase/carnithine racemase
MTSSGDDILFGVADGVATITFNRPRKGNALTVRMLQQLLVILDGLRDAHAALCRGGNVTTAGGGAVDDGGGGGGGGDFSGAHSVIVTGVGKYFCTGMDLSAGNQQKMKGAAASALFIRTLDALRALPLPTIARCNG